MIQIRNILTNESNVSFATNHFPCCCCIWPVGCVIALHEPSDWMRAKHHSLFGGSSISSASSSSLSPLSPSNRGQSALKGAGHNWGHKTWEEKKPTGLAAIDLQQVKRWTGGEREEKRGTVVILWLQAQRQTVVWCDWAEHTGGGGDRSIFWQGDELWVFMVWMDRLNGWLLDGQMNGINGWKHRWTDG